MSYPVWPIQLPAPLRDGYQLSKGDGRRLTRPEGGATRIRRRFTSMPSRLALTFLFTRDERAIFEGFYEQTLRGGSLQFLMPDFANDGWPLTDEDGATLLTEDDEPLLMDAVNLCQFSDVVPVAEVVGLEWRVSFVVEVFA